MRSIIIILLMNLIISTAAPIQGNFKSLYFNTEFSKIVKKCDSIDYDNLGLDQKLLYLESQARTAPGHKGLPRILKILAKQPQQSKILTTAAIIYHSTGQIEQACKYVNKAIHINDENYKAYLTKALLLCDKHKYQLALENLEKAKVYTQDYRKSKLLNETELKILKASQDTDSLYNYYRGLRKNACINKEYLDRIIEIYKDLNGEKLFNIQTNQDKVVVPMVNFKNSKYKCLELNINGKGYNILLDTGNSPGWTLHEPDLQDKLVAKKGGQGSMRTGSVEGKLKSYDLLTEKLNFGSFSINNLTGKYFKKPRERYFDGNINPYFIKNRVVTMDFINNQFILRTKEKFDRDLKAKENYKITKLKVYGAFWPFIKVNVNGYAPGLAMIETGAEDLSVKLEYAQRINLNLEPAVKTWRGKEYKFEKTKNLIVKAGSHIFMRDESEVWPVRFTDDLTGLYDSIMIGPYALNGNYILSFDPFANRIILESRSIEK